MGEGPSRYFLCICVCLQKGGLCSRMIPLRCICFLSQNSYFVLPSVLFLAHLTVLFALALICVSFVSASWYRHKQEEGKMEEEEGWTNEEARGRGKRKTRTLHAHFFCACFLFVRNTQTLNTLAHTRTPTHGGTEKQNKKGCFSAVGPESEKRERTMTEHSGEGRRERREGACGKTDERTVQLSLVPFLLPLSGGRPFWRERAGKGEKRTGGREGWDGMRWRERGARFWP